MNVHVCMRGHIVCVCVCVCVWKGEREGEYTTYSYVEEYKL